MQQSAQSQEMFHDGSVEADEISPSITIRRTRRVRSGANSIFDLIYTENLWSPINNTLAGCTEFDAWQSAKQWVIVTDESYNGLASAMLEGCEALSGSNTNVLLVTPRRLAETLQSMNANTPTVIVLAVGAGVIDSCTTQFDEWLQTCTGEEATSSKIHMLWLPTSRTGQTLPAHDSLEALPWCSYTILCDMANLPTGDTLKESILIMLRAAIFIDAQFMYWLEGNLSAMSEADEDLHLNAIMRSASTIFTVKRRRSDEPALPLAFTDTAALRHTTAADEQTTPWHVQARQLMLDVLYAQASEKLADTEVDRVKRVMESLDVLDAALDSSVVHQIPLDAAGANDPFVLLRELGTAEYASEFLPKAWEKANQ